MGRTFAVKKLVLIIFKSSVVELIEGGTKESLVTQIHLVHSH